MRKLLLITAAAATLAGVAPAFADDHSARLNVPRDQWMAPDQIIAKMTAQGYKVTEIESDDGAYEVEMTKDGVSRDVHVHPATGEILPGYDD
jgi:hypothetical protein